MFEDREFGGSASAALKVSLREAWEEFEQRLHADSFSLGLRPDLPMATGWIVQESHGGVRRPVVCAQNGRWLVYKPRNLAIDRCWNTLVDWYASALGTLISRSYGIWSRPSYGWTEGVVWAGCQTPEEIEAYYWRLGALAALVWALGGCDASASNIVAAGPLPTLVDAEMMLTPANEIYDSDLMSEFRSGGILPVCTTDRRGVCIAIGAAALSSYACRHGSLASDCDYCHHLPRIAGRRFALEGQEKRLIDGFEQGLITISRARRFLSGAASPIRAFGMARVRVSFRPTVVYNAISALSDSVMRVIGAGADLEALLVKLPTRVSLSPGAHQHLIRSEAASLQFGDVPRYELAGHARYLSLGSGRIQFQHAPLNRACKRVIGLRGRRVRTVVEAWSQAVFAATSTIASESCVDSPCANSSFLTNSSD